MVTRYQMYENTMGNRVSKSFNSWLWDLSVKEQRVYGSCHGVSRITLPWLRCTLTAFERRYQVRTLSNLSINNIVNTKPLDPWFITGFTEAEGSFMLKNIREQMNRFKLKSMNTKYDESD